MSGAPALVNTILNSSFLEKHRNKVKGLTGSPTVYSWRQMAEEGVDAAW